jgi:hypothetical protein
VPLIQIEEAHKHVLDILLAHVISI